MSDRSATFPVWPELLKPATAAAMLDISPSTFRVLWPVLAAKFGLRIVGLSGPKFSRTNLLGVIDGLADQGLDLRVDKSAGVVCVGGDEYPITSSRSGKSRRGRPKRQNDKI